MDIISLFALHFPSLTFLFMFQILSVDGSFLNNGHRPLVTRSYCEYLCSMHKCHVSENSSNLYQLKSTRQLGGFPNKYKRQATNAPSFRNRLAIVSAGENKTIQLPVNQAILTAFVLTESPNYKYSWELISPLNHQDIGNIEGLNTKQVKVSQLRAGNYTFRVTVTGDDNNSGSAVVSLFVLPPKESHKAPTVIIEPNAQTVQLPNKDAVLDGSSSKTFNGQPIVKYMWQAINGPIGYKHLLSNSSILKLTDLDRPGLYVFNLTVTDSQNSTNSTTASITVLKEADYPPTANAGPDIVLYLPQNEVTLNGNQSTDDKGIVSWHWSLAADDGQKSVDMDGTTTTYLHLSNLEVGVYKFVLQVTDTSNQISKAETHVFVKPENNEAPKANAGGNLEIVLPVKSPIILDGSKSSDDISISKWEWKQVEGPRNLILLDSNTSIAQIENITAGKFHFSLTVWDSKNLTSIAYKLVTVIQDKNIPPIAVGGGDKTVTLPVNKVCIDGSGSYDDAEIVAFKWERMPQSLAYGQYLVGNTVNTSILCLAGNLVAGRYLFQLTVVDAHGASGSDLVSLIVKPAVDILFHIEMVLNYDIESFTYECQMNIFHRLEVLLSKSEPIRIRLVQVDKTRERRTILIFTAHDSTERAIESVQVVRKVRSTLKSDLNYLSMQVLALDTLVCQNNCSFHGTCDHYTKRCMCEAFWMENFFSFYFDNQSNCEWSILYVIIICFAALLWTTLFLWICICCISRYQQGNHSRPSYKRKIKRTNRFHYTVISQCDNLEMVATNPSHKSSPDLSSDSEASQTLFTRDGHHRANVNKHANLRNLVT